MGMQTIYIVVLCLIVCLAVGHPNNGKGGRGNQRPGHVGKGKGGPPKQEMSEKMFFCQMASSLVL